MAHCINWSFFYLNYDKLLFFLVAGMHISSPHALTPIDYSTGSCYRSPARIRPLPPRPSANYKGLTLCHTQEERDVAECSPNGDCIVPALFNPRGYLLKRFSNAAYCRLVGMARPAPCGVTALESLAGCRHIAPHTCHLAPFAEFSFT